MATGPIRLKRNVDLQADHGALIPFTSDHPAYPMVPREDRGFVAASASSATGQTNLAQTGEGVYDGAGETWRPVKKEKTTEAEGRRLRV